MKSAIYIEDGIVQLVITPESDFEKNALKAFGEDVQATIMRGAFYDCNGGWTRWKKTYINGDICGYDTEDRSLIIRAAAKVELPE